MATAAALSDGAHDGHRRTNPRYGRRWIIDLRRVRLPSCGSDARYTSDPSDDTASHRGPEITGARRASEVLAGLQRLGMALADGMLTC